MSSPLTNLIGGKAQDAGENLNTWGVAPNLNSTLQVLANTAVRWNALAIDAGATTTISETNYGTTNDTEVAVLKLTAGTIAAAFNLVIPGRSKRLLVWNATGYACTIKLSATTGFTIPTGRFVMAATDGTADVFNLTPNYGGLTSPTTGSTDIPAWSAVETAIATAGLPATSGTVLVSGTDATAGYLRAKFTTQIGAVTTTQVSGLQSLSLGTVSGTSQQVAIIASNGYVGGFLDGGSKSAQFTPVVGTEYTCDLTASSWTINIGGMTAPQLAQRIKLNCFGNFPPFLNGTLMGQSTGYLPLAFNGELAYSGSSWGWN